jgi:hypothetical protein
MPERGRGRLAWSTEKCVFYLSLENEVPCNLKRRWVDATVQESGVNLPSCLALSITLQDTKGQHKRTGKEHDPLPLDSQAVTDVSSAQKMSNSSIKQQLTQHADPLGTSTTCPLHVITPQHSPGETGRPVLHSL